MNKTTFYGPSYPMDGSQADAAAPCDATAIFAARSQHGCAGAPEQSPAARVDFSERGQRSTTRLPDADSVYRRRAQALNRAAQANKRGK